MGEQDVHRGLNGCLGEQDRCAANLAESLGLLHRKMARAKTTLASHCKTFAFQGCSPCSAKVSSAAEEETTLMMFSLLQEQHKAKLKLMAAANKQAMDTMFERMNALITGHGKAGDKVTAPITNSSTGCAPSTTNLK